MCYGKAIGRLARSCISAAKDSACHFMAVRKTITETIGVRIDAVIAAQKIAIESDCADWRTALARIASDILGPRLVYVETVGR